MVSLWEIYLSSTGRAFNTVEGVIREQVEKRPAVMVIALLALIIFLFWLMFNLMPLLSDLGSSGA